MATIDNEDYQKMRCQKCPNDNLIGLSKVNFNFSSFKAEANE